MARKTKKTGITLFAKNLKRLMAEKELTVRAAANLAKVSSSTLDGWRAGTTPDDYMAVKRLALALGVSFSFLLTGEDDRPSEGQPSIAEVFSDGGSIFDGYAKITIQRLIPRKADSKNE